MVASIHRPLIAGLVIAAASIASAETAGDSDNTVWRWHVTNILRAQRDAPDQPRSDAPDQSRYHVIKRAGPFLADGSGAPSGDRGRH